MAASNEIRPFKEGMWVVDAQGEPRLLASQCDACGELFFPVKSNSVCTHCYHQGLRKVAIGPYARLVTYTAVMQPPAGGYYHGEVPYYYGLVDLDEGVRVQSLLRGNFGSFYVGMRMKLFIEPLYRESDGSEIHTYCFRPKL